MGNPGITPEVALRVLESLERVTGVIDDWAEGTASAMVRWPY